MAGLRRTFVVGVGMTKFFKPGSGVDYPQLASQAVNMALKDAGVSYKAVQQAYVGYVYGDSTCGQRAVYEVGMTGIPIVNVNNNCSTGSSALYLGRQMVQGGLADCILALGFEIMAKGSLTSPFPDRTNPLEKFVMSMANQHGLEAAPIPAQLFGNAGKEHMQRYGTRREHFQRIAYKNHRHSVNNPLSQFTKEYSMEEIAQAPLVFDPLTKLQCCPTSDGAAAAILASEEFVVRNKLQDRAVEIRGMAMATDLPSTLEEQSSIKLVGYDMSKAAAEKAYKEAGLSPGDVNVVELHDCFSANELITYEALGLCEEGKAGEFIDSGNNTYGGRVVVNPSGGLISKGHPLGATGLAQCAELSWQLRNMADKRQVPNAQVALQHNLGLGGAAVVSLYKLGYPQH